MKSRSRLLTAVFSSSAMLFLILDAKTSLSGAQAGITACIQTVIPSLLPFFFLSILINTSLSGCRLGILKPVCTLLHIPQGGESLLLLGLIGGYPIGAQSIATVYENGSLVKSEAQRLLGFCSNAGPAFIFGMCASLFASPLAGWALWAIHILSALCVGVILPCQEKTQSIRPTVNNVCVSQAIVSALRAISTVCGWVIIFRIIIAILNRWMLWLLPKTAQCILMGMLELTNGCISLYTIPSEGLRFILCACLLSFGGILSLIHI